MVLSKGVFDGLKDPTISFKDLVNEGVVEWVDAEEEEDLLVAPRPFDLPQTSPKHGRPINPAKVSG
ncbi:MAG: hypothetical protein Ct9H90mP16_21950 [Candidatus Poseidoniales archaeon]|nr:MAG: hypothetical protein Ct9H90mP16_21950 [Candidatus Poseidoniales archaeon]